VAIKENPRSLAQEHRVDGSGLAEKSREPSRNPGTDEVASQGGGSQQMPAFLQDRSQHGGSRRFKGLQRRFAEERAFQQTNQLLSNRF
jgi:hypothetical protein